MGKQTPRVFDSASQKATLWLKDIQATGKALNRFQAYAALRAVLHALRDCLPPAAAGKLAAQMPLLIKGVFFDGWKVAAKPSRLSREEFMSRIRDELRGQSNVNPALALEAVVRALYRNISCSEIEAMCYVLPRHVRAAVQSAVADLRKDEGIYIEREAPSERPRRRSVGMGPATSSGQPWASA